MSSTESSGLQIGIAWYGGYRGRRETGVPAQSHQEPQQETQTAPPIAPETGAVVGNVSLQGVAENADPTPQPRPGVIVVQSDLV